MIAQRGHVEFDVLVVESRCMNLKVGLAYETAVARRCSGVNLSHAVACVSEELPTKAYAVTSTDGQGQAVL